LGWFHLIDGYFGGSNLQQIKSSIHHNNPYIKKKKRITER